jgi:PAS domain S-box-containing protein
MAGGSKRDIRLKGAWRFRDLLEAAPDAMVVVDHGGKIVLVNAQAEKVFGYQRDELLGRDVEILLPMPLREIHRGHRAHYHRQPRVRPMGAGLEMVALRKGGTKFPVEISLSPVETEDGVLVTNAIRDVTERKLLEEARFKLAAIVESSDDAIISKTLEGIITSWNTSAGRIFGYTEEEAVGQPIAMLIPPELQSEENRILERLKTGKRIDHYETIRITKAGEKVDVSLTISPIKDSAGRIIGASKVARDITDRKRSEAALASVSRQLLETVESERARIGRELHDDINQRLAMLAIEIDELRHAPSIDVGKIDDRLKKFGENIEEISTDLSHVYM